jgi:hypothetical protein
LIGVSASVTGAYGSFDSGRVLHGQPAGSGEVDFLETLLVTTRVIEPLQINVSFPLAETWRSAPGVTDFGGGVSDMSLAIRWDMLRAGIDKVVPGIATTASLTLPTGTPPELAKDPLASGATGLGSAQLGAGLAFEQLFGRLLFVLTGSIVFHGARTVAGVQSQLGPDIQAVLGASYTFPSGIGLGATARYMSSLDATASGQDVPGSMRATTQFAVSLAFPLRKLDSRLLASIFVVPPISSVAQNEPGTLGASLTFIYGFARRATCYGTHP